MIYNYDFSKQIKNFDSIINKQQEKFNKLNIEYVKNIINCISPKKMSEELITSIEENYHLSYYCKLRLLAEEQKNYFKQK